MMLQITDFIYFFMLFPKKIVKTAQYRDATNNTRPLIFLRYFPWK